MTPAMQLADDGSTLAVDGMIFHALWLRDACACGECRRPSTNERLLDSTSIPPSIAIEFAEASAAGIALRFSDGHLTVLDVNFLRRHTPAAHDRTDRPMGGRSVWVDAQAQPPMFDRAELDDRATRLRWVDAIWNRGMAIVSGVDPTESGLLATAGLIGTVLPSNYGMTWTIEATVTPTSNVNSEVGLQVHTDLPYRQTPPGLQLILAGVTDVAGGASTFVDGYAVADEIRRTDRDAWQLLTTVAFTYPYERTGVHLHGAAPLITLRPDGEYEFIRRAPDLVGMPIVGVDQTAELYEALRLWSRALDAPANQLSYRLEPGELVAFDNHRMLHGRTPFELGASGRRYLLGCYLDIDELNNCRAVLAGGNNAD